MAVLYLAWKVNRVEISLPAPVQVDPCQKIRSGKTDRIWFSPFCQSCHVWTQFTFVNAIPCLFNPLPAFSLPYYWAQSFHLRWGHDTNFGLDKNHPISLRKLIFEFERKVTIDAHRRFSQDANTNSEREKGTWV